MDKFIPLLIIICSLSLFMNIALLSLLMWVIEKYDALYNAVMSNCAALDTLVNIGMDNNNTNTITKMKRGL